MEDICEDPTKIRDQVKRYVESIMYEIPMLWYYLVLTSFTARRLNREVVAGFVQLVKSLVHKPLENKYVTDKRLHADMPTAFSDSSGSL